MTAQHGPINAHLIDEPTTEIALDDAESDRWAASGERLLEAIVTMLEPAEAPQESPQRHEELPGATITELRLRSALLDSEFVLAHCECGSWEVSGLPHLVRESLDKHAARDHTPTPTIAPQALSNTLLPLMAAEIGVSLSPLQAARLTPKLGAHATMVGDDGHITRISARNLSRRTGVPVDRLLEMDPQEIEARFGVTLVTAKELVDA